MKWVSLLIILLIMSCDDMITITDPSSDIYAPEITIAYPINGSIIDSLELSVVDMVNCFPLSIILSPMSVDSFCSMPSNLASLDVTFSENDSIAITSASFIPNLLTFSSSVLIAILVLLSIFGYFNA